MEGVATYVTTVAIVTVYSIYSSYVISICAALHTHSTYVVIAIYVHVKERAPPLKIS